MEKVVWDGKATGEVENVFDAYIAEQLLSEGRHVGNADDTMTKYEVANLAGLAEKQKQRLAENPKLTTLFYEIESPLTKILYNMEQQGILLDTKRLTLVGQDIDKLLKTVQGEINKETDGGINLNSPLQLGNFLVEKLGVPLGKTKTGKYATNEGELTKFTEQFPLIKHILDYRELAKLRSTYVETLIGKVDKGSRIHTTYHQVAIATGRLASSNPNLQNIPVTSQIGQEIKSCFVADKGKILVSFDYSQQELRILAHLTGEEALIKAFEEHRDVHRLTAERLFKVPYDEVTQEQRRIGKTINFGIIYGMSGFGMSVGLNIPVEDGDTFIQEFYAAYPKIKSYYDKYISDAKQNDYAETLLGRRRYVFEDPKRKFIDNSMRRVLMNYPIQGSAADLMKKAMVDVDKKVLSKHKDVSLLLQIHDDLVFEIPDSDSEKMKKITEEIKEILCSVYPLAVPLEVEVKHSKRWGIY